MDATALLHFDDRLHVGLAAMDRTHEEFARCVNALLTAPAAGLAGALGALIAHLETHFALEEQLMSETKFPAAGCHADEHARVMASAHEVQQQLADGGADLVRAFAQALADWFPGHSDYMDAALATWVVKRRTQGAPIVLRRSLTAPRGAQPQAA
jgi:hemerythrin